MAQGNTWTGLGEGLQGLAQTIMQMYQLRRENEDRALRQKQVQSQLDNDALSRALQQKQLERFDQEKSYSDAKRTMDIVGIEEMLSNPSYADPIKALGINAGQRVLPSRSLGGSAPMGSMTAQPLAPTGEYANGVQLPAEIARQRQMDLLKLRQQTAQAGSSEMGLQEDQRKAAALRSALGSAPQNTPQGRLNLAGAGINPAAVLGETQEDPAYLRQKYGAQYGAMYGAMKSAGGFPEREDPSIARQYRNMTTIVDNISQELRRLETIRPSITDPQGTTARNAKIAQLRSAQQKLYAALLTEQPDPQALREAITALTAPEPTAASTDPTRNPFQ